jgi:hypothetical protein
LPVLKRRSRMISFRLSDEEYASLRSLCENEGIRSVSALARDAVHRRMHKESQIPVEVAVRALEGRVNILDDQIKRLAFAMIEPPLGAMRQSNGKT